MNPIILLLLVISSMLLPLSKGLQAARPDRANKKLTTVREVDINRYMGRWYEIARIPNRFQRKCAKNTTATYRMLDNGRVEVVNRCLRRDGRQVLARGEARLADTTTRSKLKVSFVSLLGIRLFWGKYWIIGLDPDYQWALVGEPKRKYGWILARTPALNENDRETIQSLLIKQGYDPGRFENTVHTPEP